MPIPRHLQSRLLKGADKFPVVTLTGPRQSGKTTLTRMALPDHEYVNLEDPDERRWATDDPRGFLDRFKEQVVIDEARHVPDLFSYIQGIVDRAGTTGLVIYGGDKSASYKEDRILSWRNWG